MATHTSILAWEIPWTEEPGGLQSMGSQKSQTWLSNETTTTIGMCLGGKRLIPEAPTWRRENKSLLNVGIYGNTWSLDQRTDQSWLTEHLSSTVLPTPAPPGWWHAGQGHLCAMVASQKRNTNIMTLGACTGWPGYLPLLVSRETWKEKPDPLA